MPIKAELRPEGLATPKTISVNLEPTTIGIGANHVVVGAGIRASFYDITNFEGTLFAFILFSCWLSYFQRAI